MKSIGFKLTAIMLCVILIGIAGTVGVGIGIASGIITGETLEKVNQNTLYNEEKLNKWLQTQETSINVLASILAYDEALAEVLTSDRTAATMTLEEEVADTLRPTLKAALESNDASFEIYLGLLDGTALNGSGYQFDYSWWVSYERGWYNMALTDTSAHILRCPTLTHRQTNCAYQQSVR